MATATTAAQRQTDLIREYRTRLIADVVTGKLDVRGVSVPDLDEDTFDGVERITDLDDLDEQEKNDVES